MAQRKLTKRQRQWVIDRDVGQCMWHTYYPGKGLVRCPNKTNLHVHHIKPHRWLARKFTNVIELPENLITLCKNHHIGRIHPDMHAALRNYHRDRASIKKVFSKRDELVAQGVPYWVQRWDDFFQWLAKEATSAYKVPWPK